MSENQVIPNVPAAADTPPTAPMLTPEQFIEQLRIMMTQVPDIPSLTAPERRFLQRQTRIPRVEAAAAINVVEASAKAATAVSEPPDEVRRLIDVEGRWAAVETEVKAMLQGIADANLVRRQRIASFAIQAYGIGQQLARDPENTAVTQHVQEVKRLKALRRRKKAAPEPPPVTPGTQQQS